MQHKKNVLYCAYITYLDKSNFYIHNYIIQLNFFIWMIWFTFFKHVIKQSTISQALSRWIRNICKIKWQPIYFSRKDITLYLSRGPSTSMPKHASKKNVNNESMLKYSKQTTTKLKLFQSYGNLSTFCYFANP